MRCLGAVWVLALALVVAPAGAVAKITYVQLEPVELEVTEGSIPEIMGLSHHAEMMKASAAEAGPPTIEDFFLDPIARNVGLTPSGRYFYAVRRMPTPDDPKKSIDRFFLIDLEGQEKPKAVDFGTNHVVGWIEWATEQRVLISVYIIHVFRRRGRYYGIAQSRVLSVDRETLAGAVLFGEETRILRSNFNLSAVTNMLPNDPDHIMMPAFVRNSLDLFKVNIITGAAEAVMEGARGTFYWYTDDNGKPLLRFDTNRSRTKIYVYSWSDEKSEWVLYQTIDIREDSESLDFRPIAQGTGPDLLYVLAHPETEERSTIKLYDTKKREFVSTVLEHPEVDIRGGVIDSKSEGYAGGWYIDDRFQVALTNELMQRHVEAVDEYFERDANVLMYESNDNGSRILTHVSGPRIPGEYHLYHFDRTQMEFLFSVNPRLPRERLGRMQSLRIPARDGTPLRSYLTHPPGGETGEQPLIVMPHGGPEYFDYHKYDNLVQFLATRGYRVLQLNFRGSSNQGRSFASAGYGEWGGLMQDDVSDAVRHLFDQGLAMPERTCIVGASYGGYVALYGAVSTPELYSCAVSIAGVTNLSKMLDYEKDKHGEDSDVFSYWTKSIGDLTKDKEKLDARSPELQAARITVPILLAHGEDDKIVPVSQSRDMRKAMRRANGEVEYVEFDDTGHNRWSDENQKKLWQRLEAFLKKHIGQEPAGALTTANEP